MGKEIKVPTLDRMSVERLNRGQHPDPYACLGMHRRQGGTLLVVRALLPGAQTVRLLSAENGEPVVELLRYPDSDLFEGVPGRKRKPFPYLLEVTYSHSREVIDDPFAFSSRLDERQSHYFSEGSAERLYDWMGAHPVVRQGVPGCHFCLWAPNARAVSVVGDFNFWNASKHPMRKHPASGLWDSFIPGVGAQTNYKFSMVDAGGATRLKSDPLAFGMQHPPETASVVRPELHKHPWQDQEWMSQRIQQDKYGSPISIYEVHAGSWRRKEDEGNRYLSYAELADELIPYVLDMGFTHVQFMPLGEYPFDGSWGYQPVGLFAPSSRFGSAEEFQQLVDRFHQAGLGVLLDWVPGHFPSDEHGLARFDGTALYEHEDPRKGYHPDWNTFIYNYDRAEVRSFLIANALYWMDKYHLDGLRVDAVASMLYLDYSREPGEWIPNRHGGRENLEAVELLQQVNRRLYANFPGAFTVAEESTAWAGVSHPVDSGGLGFGFKWNMGWMNDTLSYMARDPIHRRHHHSEISFGLVYAFEENFVLPLSHDEVVHGKGSLLERMPGDSWHKFANLRACFGFMWTHPGKKLLFMGGEFAQRNEWNHDQGLDWHLLEDDAHRGVSLLVRDLNRLYRSEPALHQCDCSPEGFEWIDYSNDSQSIFAYVRWDRNRRNAMVAVVNMTPTPHSEFELGMPLAGYWQEVLNTDSEHYGGSNMGNFGGLHTREGSRHGQPCHLKMSVPPLATTVLKCPAS